MNTRSISLIVIALGLCSLTLLAADWPQWRGPQRNGISQETGLLKEWPEGGPKLLWQVKDVGFGYSTPAVVGERMYLLGNTGEDNEFVQALNVANGQRIWAVTLGKVGPNRGQNYPGARSTPTVEGDVLYALSSDGDLACVETAGGTIRWKKSLRADFGGRTGNWAYSESPLIDGDAVVVTPGGAEATMVALNKRTGETIWKTAVPEGEEAAYSSIIIVEAGGMKQYVNFLKGGLIGVEAKTGKVLWRYAKTAQGSPANIPTPVARDVFVYSATGRGGGGLVELKASQGAVEAAEVYAGARLPKDIGGAIELNGFLYGSNGEGMMCVEFATGTVRWQERTGPGSICYAEGRLYFHAERDGYVSLMEATPETYLEKGRFNPPEQPTERGEPSPKAWAYPVVANGRLFIRDLGVLWCYDVKAAK